MEKQMTAVEWLAKEICYISIDGKYIVDNAEDVTHIVEQAKEMEKKQAIEFAEEYSSKCSSVHNGIVFNSEPADQYYNKKYSQE